MGRAEAGSGFRGLSVGCGGGVGAPRNMVAQPARPEALAYRSSTSLKYFSAAIAALTFAVNVTIEEPRRVAYPRGFSFSQKTIRSAAKARKGWHAVPRPCGPAGHRSRGQIRSGRQGSRPPLRIPQPPLRVPPMCRRLSRIVAAKKRSVATSNGRNSGDCRGWGRTSGYCFPIRAPQSASPSWRLPAPSLPVKMPAAHGC
jgi:hypothetical protein